MLMPFTVQTIPINSPKPKVYSPDLLAARSRFYAVPHNIPSNLAEKLEQYKAAKATPQSSIRTKAPVAELKKLAKLRKEEIDAGK